MSLLSPFKKKAPAGPESNAAPPCDHWELAPRWDKAADIGTKERAVAFVCAGCGKSFEPSEVADRV